MAFNKPAKVNWYEVLHVTLSSSKAEIKKQNKQLLIANHPHKAIQLWRKPEVEELCQMLNEAYRILNIEENLRLFDQQLVHNGIEVRVARNFFNISIFL